MKYSTVINNRNQKGGIAVARDIPTYTDKTTGKTENAKKTYDWFPSVAWFLTFYESVEEKNFYEIIIEGSSLRFFMDIDLSVSEFPVLQQIVPAERQEFCVAFVKEVIRKGSDLLCFDQEKVNVYTSIDESGKKYSFHIVFDCYCDHIKKVHQWCLDIKQKMAASLLLNSIDERVYEKNKLFRLLGSTKYGANRVKKFKFGINSTFELS